LFEAYVNGDSPRNLLPDDWKELYDESSGDKRSKARIACDYISGMTDSYAAKIYARLFLPEAGSVYEVL
jgi:dGTPase